jgi:hypothetical protein
MLRFLFDAYCYTNFPKLIPIVTNAICMPTFFVLVEKLGWIYGLVSGVIIYILLEPLNQSTILVGSSRASCGFAWGLIVTITGYYFLSLSAEFSFFVNMIVATLAVCICYSLVSSTSTVPHHLQGQDAESR